MLALISLVHYHRVKKIKSKYSIEEFYVSRPPPPLERYLNSTASIKKQRYNIEINYLKVFMKSKISSCTN